MIDVHLQGRLGNVLFQYAVGRHLALKNNTDFSLNFEYYIRRDDLFGGRIRNLLKHFNIKKDLYSKIGAKYVLKIVGINWPFPRYDCFEEYSHEFLPEVLKLDKGTEIKGFFQSEKYFEEIEQVIRNDLKIDSSTLGRSAGTMKGKYYQKIQ